MTKKKKHPCPAHSHRTPSDPGDNPRFEALQVAKEDVMRALGTFPLGSSGGPDGITPQHIRNLLTGSTDDSLQQAMVNLMLAGAFDKEVNSVIFGQD